MKQLFKMVFMCTAIAASIVVASCNNPADTENKINTNQTYIVTFRDAVNGKAEAEPATAKEGTEITITATPDTGYGFTGWTVVSGVEQPAGNPAKFEMPASDVVLTPVFAFIQTYAVDVTASNSGTAEASPAGPAAEGATVTLTAKANNDYVFTGWTVLDGDISPANTNPASFLMPAGAVSVRAEFASTLAPVVKEPPYILFLGQDDKLNAGAWGNVSMENILYFKFGGVVGSSTSEVTTVWNQYNLKYNPSGWTPSPSTTWTNVPSALTGGGLNTTVGYYGADTYFTAANIKRGMGDPCRLVGLSGAQVRAMSDAALAAYDSGLRILSTTEAMNIGGSQNGSRTDHMFAPPTAPILGAVLPHSGNEAYDVSKFLPVAGDYRGTSDANFGMLEYAAPNGSSGGYAYGRYWLDTANNDYSQSYALTFGNTVGSPKGIQPNYAILHPSSGLTVRCMIKQ